MKNILKATVLLLLSTILYSCKGDQGIPGTSGIGQISNITINVSQDKWAYSGLEDNNYFYATVNMPEITKEIFNGGLIKMYRLYDFNLASAYQMELPYVRLKEWFDKSGTQYTYVETVDYEVYLGEIKIYYTASDFDYELDESFVPEAMQFRCVIMY